MKHKGNEKFHLKQKTCRRNAVWNKVKMAGMISLMLGVISGSSEICAAKDKVIITGDSVSMYSWASTRSVRLQDIDGQWFTLQAGQEAEYVWETTASDGALWCKIGFVDENGIYQRGYVPMNRVEIEKEKEYKKDKKFEAWLKKQGFPESYKDALRKLHVKHPNWIFKGKKVNIRWDKAVEAQSSIGKNTVPALSYESFKSKAKGAYDEETDAYTEFAGGQQVSADSELIAFYMDPRNFLSEENIFQFYSLSEFNKNQTKKTINKLLEETFIEGEKADGKTEYAKVFLDAAKKANVNPYYLVWKFLCVTEGEKNQLVSGEFDRFSGVYNFYGVGGSSLSDVTNMMIYASASDKETQRPWNTEKKAIVGGAVALAQEYIAKKQNTLYSQRFDIAGTLFVHQNARELYSGAKEAYSLAQFLKYNMDEPLVFEIPYYEKMPDETIMTVKDKSSNNLLSHLQITGQVLTPSFDSKITDYYLVADENTEQLQVQAEAVNPEAQVKGDGSISLKDNKSVYSIKVKAQNDEVKTYKLHVSRKKTESDSSYQYKVDKKLTLNSRQYPIHKSGYLYGIPQGITVQELMDSLYVEKGSVQLLNAKGKELKGIVTTGSKCRILNNKGKKVKDISICVQGDINGDGAVDVLDLLSASRHMHGIAKLKGIYLTAGDFDLGEDKLTQQDVETLSGLIFSSQIAGQGK